MQPVFRLALACCLVTAAAWAKPALFIIGDSTVRNRTEGQLGWGDPLVGHFDPAKIRVVNLAIGGRSSRSFLAEGRWDAVTAQLQPGDFVIMQFGHNDGGPLDDERGRASLKGNGDETGNIVRKGSGEPETVRSYGWYLRKYIADTKAKGAAPIVLSPIPRNIWKDGKIGRADKDYGAWARQAAEQGGAVFIDFNALLSDRYEALGREKTGGFFTAVDHTHTNAAGAEFNAAALADALRGTDLGPCLLPANAWLPRIFSDRMVLQRDTPNPLWGTAIPGAQVSAAIAGKNVAGTVGDDGRFRLDLPALPAGGPHELTVTISGISRNFTDVLVGEVWFCSGQSNMDFTLAPSEKRYFAGAAAWKEEVSAADHPQLRMFTAEWTMSEDPRCEIEGEWLACSPETAPGFSAVAYYFGLELQRELCMPIGLVTCAYGGSTAEAWIGAGTLAGDAVFKPLLDAFRKKSIACRDNPALLADHARALARWTAAGRKGRAPKHPDPVQDPHSPSVLFNGMIAPIVPYGIRGAIWYQGESNVGTRQLYPALLRALIEDWRARWGRGNFPFYFVQLAAHKAPSAEPSDSSLASMREAQASSLALPHTGMAVTIDIGDEKDVHPRNKRDVGHRLARLALHSTYGRAVVPSGPRFRTFEIEDGRIRLRFDHIAGGLVAKDGPLKHFAIAGDDRKFVWADAEIEGGTVVVSSPTVLRPTHVRYAWADNPAGANLYNSENLPAAPFRTDP